MKFNIPEMKMHEHYGHSMSGCGCSKQHENTCGIMWRSGS